MSAGGPQDFWRRRVVEPIVAQLRQGISADSIALTLALAAVLGVFPVFGATTFLCVIAAIWLRLNQPLMQLANYLLTPLHLALLLPFYRAGETLFRQEHVPILSVGDLAARFEAGPRQFLVDYGCVVLYGIGVWTLLAAPVAALLFLVLRPVLRRLALRIGAPRAAAG
ncbi:DUF2062 domain-containing protein [Solimonas soli]|uniref:DUF2062 domain-containing protein n=1 Tax=Solimonas soli TaxID=413479 RepID=UPI0004823CD9|nr:DUF2062 domain-containing protein [Solimonas soli]